MNRRKIAAVAGFVILGLSPSYVDWQKFPDQRKNMLVFYGVGTGLICYGVTL